MLTMMTTGNNADNADNWQQWWWWWQYDDDADNWQQCWRWWRRQQMLARCPPGHQITWLLLFGFVNLCSMANTSEKYERTQQGNLLARCRSKWVGEPENWPGAHQAIISPAWHSRIAQHAISSSSGNISGLLVKGGLSLSCNASIFILIVTTTFP